MEPAPAAKSICWAWTRVVTGKSRHTNASSANFLNTVPLSLRSGDHDFRREKLAACQTEATAAKSEPRRLGEPKKNTTRLPVAAAMLTTFAAFKKSSA